MHWHEPLPRQSPIDYLPFQWMVNSRQPLSVPSSLTDTPFVTVLDNRYSRRTFAELAPGELDTFLWLSSREIEAGQNNNKQRISHRPALSAGALHPVHILLTDKCSDRWSRYDPFDHAVECLVNPSSKWLDIASKVLDVQRGKLLFFVAEPAITASKYENPESLIFRDAGVMLGIMALCAEYLGLNFCPLGITGNALVGDLDDQGRLMGVGMAVLGS